MNKHINILIADDHQIFLDGLKMIFSDHKDWKIVAEAKDGTEVLHYFNTTKIDLAILDVNMPKPNGFDLSKNIKQNFPNCKIMILSMYGDEQFMNEFVKPATKDSRLLFCEIFRSQGRTDIVGPQNSFTATRENFFL